MTQSSSYDPAWYDYHRDVALKSARGVVPHLINFVHPQRVVDLGCGTGEWLSVFQAYGVTEVLGIDGDWVPRE
jgi:trans-aconitate methyltransferase